MREAMRSAEEKESEAGDVLAPIGLKDAPAKLERKPTLQKREMKRHSLISQVSSRFFQRGQTQASRRRSLQKGQNGHMLIHRPSIVQNKGKNKDGNTIIVIINHSSEKIRAVIDSVSLAPQDQQVEQMGSLNRIM